MSFLNPMAKLPDAEKFLEEHAVGAYKRLVPPTEKLTTLAVKQNYLSRHGITNATTDIKVKDIDGKVYASVNAKSFQVRERAVIDDANGTPVCCILEKMLSVGPSYFIYSFKPYFDGQQPSGEKEGGKDLYAWAKVWKKVMSMIAEYEICMAVGDDTYQPPGSGLFKAKAPAMASTKLQVTKDGRGCALIDRGVIGFDDFVDNVGWTLTISKGIDPVLMISLIAIADAINNDDPWN